MRTSEFLVVLPITLFIGCAPVAPPATQDPKPPVARATSIGTATMDRRGTITLNIRSLGPGPRAEARLIYRKGDPNYNDILEHLGGLNPGDIKPVPPWPDAAILPRKAAGRALTHSGGRCA